MAPNRDLILVAQAAETIDAVAGAVDRSTDEISWERCDSLDDLQLRLDHELIPTVVVDIGSSAERALRDLDPIINRYTDSRFILLSTETPQNLMVLAMQSGVRHLLRNDRIGVELPQVLRRFISGGVSQNGALGSIVSVFSAGGGTGATTIAINLASELAHDAGRKSLLIDLDCNFGSVAAYLGITSQFGIADVLADGDRIDPALIASTTVAASERLDVLVSPATCDFESPKVPEFDHLSRLLHQSRQVYANTVIDAPRLPMEVSFALARSSVIAYIVLEMNVHDVRIARDLYRCLIAYGVRPDYLVPIINRYRGRRESISLDEALATIGCRRIETMGNDYRSAIECLNYGHTLAEQASRSTLRKDLSRCIDGVRAAMLERRQSSIDASIDIT